MISDPALTRSDVAGHTSAVHAGHVVSAVGGMTRLAYARAKTEGIALDSLLARARLAEDQIENPSARIQVRSQIAFLDLVADALNDRYLGFHLAHSADLREMGLLYYVLASSTVLIDALQRIARYSTIVNEGLAAECIDGRNVGLSLRHVGVSRVTDRHQTEFWMTAIVRTCRQLTGRRLLPNRVRFMHHRNHPSPAYSAFFGHDIEFDAATDEFTLPKSVKDLAIIHSDPYLNNLLISYCEEALSRRQNRPGPFRVRVENAIVPRLPHGEARADAIAPSLGVSQRTFARRLASEGLTFSGVLENLRFDLANRYLADEDLSISQIAWLLGYQEVSAFSHAFKRWTGKTPREAPARATSLARSPARTSRNGREPGDHRGGPDPVR